MAALELAVAYLIAGALELGDDPAAAAVYRELAVMTPEGHPESGWNTFSAYEDDDGRVVTQVQSLARANDPVYEVGFRLVGSTEQERIWAHVLKSVAAHFDCNEPVILERVCVDPKLQWSQARNLCHNAGARSMLYTMSAPLRWRRDRPRT
jgi:FAD/FMN-containing dehydrogenase